MDMRYRMETARTAAARIAYDSSSAALYTPEVHDTVFQQQASYSPLQIGVEGARLAYYRAEESAAEYQRLARALARIGFEPPTLINDATTGAELFASWRSIDSIALVAFRGTRLDDVADLGTNINVAAAMWSESAGLVHCGFAAAARAVLPQLTHWIKTQAVHARKIIFTGHSLGAAVATLASSVLRPTLLVSLGSPRVGNRTFFNSLSTVRTCRLVNCCDVVTETPPELSLYTHVHEPMYITREGIALPDVDVDVKAIARDRLRARFDYLKNESLRPGAVPVRDLADHSPINYVRAFFP